MTDPLHYALIILFLFADFLATRRFWIRLVITGLLHGWQKTRFKWYFFISALISNLRKSFFVGRNDFDLFPIKFNPLGLTSERRDDASGMIFDITPMRPVRKVTPSCPFCLENFSCLIALYGKSSAWEKHIRLKTSAARGCLITHFSVLFILTNLRRLSQRNLFR